MEKSHVGMGYKLCLGCDAKYDEVILLEKRIRNGKLMQTLDRENVMGIGLCPVCTKVTEDGFVFLVSVADDSDHANPTMTGTVIRMKRELAQECFSAEIKTVAFVTDTVIDGLVKQVAEHQKEESNE